MRLYGKRPVIERLKKAPSTIRTLYVQQGAEASDVVRAARQAGLTFQSLSKTDFSRMAGVRHNASADTRRWAVAGDVHAQGVLAEVAPFTYTPFETVLKSSSPRPTLLLLDRITDPQNLGAVVRTTACLGGFALVLPKHESAEVNETVLRVACGGENYVTICRVTNLVQAAEQAKKGGYWIAGAAGSGGEDVMSANWPAPLGVILGSEGSGIRPGLRKHLDLTLTLPMPGAALSYNVATAAALIAYEITRRKLQSDS